MESGLHKAAFFTTSERDAVYKAIHTRRDVRSQFLPQPLAPDVVARILLAGHHAPSVGFMQPWDFLLIDDAAAKQAVHNVFAKANTEATAMFTDQRQLQYQQLKLEGIMQAPLNICITCSKERNDGPVLGRTHMPEMDSYSTVCAVQNIWLAARAEGVGIGWVSIFKPEELREVLGIPANVQIVAYLCVGYVDQLYGKPELEYKNWAKRSPLASLLHQNGWQKPVSDNALLQALEKEMP